MEPPWSILEKRYRERPFSNKRQMEKILREKWKKTDHKVTENLIKSMPQRLREIIRRRGRELDQCFSNYAPRSGKTVEADKDAIKALVDANRRITTREMGLRFNLSNSTVYDQLKGLGLSSKIDIWVPHVLTERNLCRRIDVCDSLLKRRENDPFLKRIITGDENGHGAKKMNRLKQFPKSIFPKKR
ncbi:histone-lysine N-methyltransferase SETMAR [Trichonephila clavipes]|nr:histone-lysine N-methyltransferase SETMAR [Trichonephila clavipes]